MKPSLFLFFISLSFNLFAGGVKGIVKTDEGTPLPYASIFVKQTGAGATTDQNGYYELSLTPGHYEIIFKFLGYEAVTRIIDVEKTVIELNIVLKEQNILLQNITVASGQEDAAYTIMRKAIAKAKFHTLLLDTYSAKVYIKGKGKLRDYPWLAKRMLEKEGITKDRLFITESVNEIKYTRPNKYEQKVIAVYTQGKDRSGSPNQYFFGSFYEPEIAETVSPLSYRAFTYYKFEYLGTFKDGGYDISKIKVTPRSKGDNVFEGTIFIVENWWSIHSLELTTIKQGVHVKMKQIYHVIDDKVWMPVSQEAIFNGKILGFDFIASYYATVKEYKIKVNPALVSGLDIIDEKLEKDEAKKIKKQFSQKNQQLKQRLESGKEITTKELNQLTKAYEKAEQEKQKVPDVISESTYVVDSSAYKKDTSFWANIRPAALDKEEIRGYKKADSLSEVQRKRDEGDTLHSKKKHNRFSPFDVITGNTYSAGKNSTIKIHTLWGGYNTVEGVNAFSHFSYYHRWVKKDSLHPEKKADTKRLEISPTFRYAFAREKLTGFLRADYRTHNAQLTLSGGKYIQQFNSDEPIIPLINTFTTLFLGQNWMKLYERDFIDFNFKQKFQSKYTFRTQWSLARRHELFNNNNYTFNSKSHLTPNEPINVELPNTGFSQNTAFIGSISIEAKPWQKFKIFNNNKYQVNRSSPTITVDYKKGFSQIFGSDIDYDLLELGFKESVRTGITGWLDLNLKAGKFLNAKSIYFIDYKHFIGNQTPFVTSDPLGSFSLLPYYTYSTRNQYFSANVHYRFRKFLITRIPKARLFGLSESFFLNYLVVPSSINYTELGYGLNGILRLFRLEFATSFQNGTYTNNGFRIGISTNLLARFSDN